MKIAILSFYSGHLERGVERWVDELAMRLARGHEVTVLQNGPVPENKVYEVLSTNIDIDMKTKDTRGTLTRRFFVDYWSRKVALSTLKNLPLLLKNKYDVVIPTSGGWQPAIVRLLTWIRGGKMVVVGHSGKGWDEMNNIFCFPDVFVGLSTFACKWAKSINPFLRTVYIPDGIDLNFFHENDEKIALDLERPIFIAVGATEKNKRLDLAIGAVANLKKGSLVILGGGYDEAVIESLGVKMLEKRFLMRKVHFNEVPKYLRSADVFTIPSMGYYSFEMVLLEAMSCNLPVVANDDPIRAEIVGDAGILVDPVDIDTYSRVLYKVFKTDWGDKPRKQALRFSWDKVVGQYENLFRKLTQKTG